MWLMIIFKLVIYTRQVFVFAKNIIYNNIDIYKIYILYKSLIAKQLFVILRNVDTWVTSIII